MKKLLFHPLFVLVIGVVAGVFITLIPPVKNWKLIKGPEKNCFECYQPEGGSIPGIKALNSKEAQVDVDGFAALSQSLSMYAKDSSGQSLWTITNRGGYLHRDLLRTLLGSLSDSQDRVGYYFGLTPGSNFLRIVFIKGDRQCLIKKDGNEAQPVFYSADVVATDNDSSTTCPTNCPIIAPPDGVGPIPAPEPEPDPSDS